MKKEFITKLLVNYALAVLALVIIPPLMLGVSWITSATLLWIFLITLSVRFSLLATQQLNIKSPIREYALNYVLISAQVYLASWLLNWLSYIPNDRIWVISLLITVVFVFAYILDLAYVHSSVTEINKQLQSRRQRKEDCEE